LRACRRRYAGWALAALSAGVALQSPGRSFAAPVFVPLNQPSIDNCRKAALALHAGQIVYIGERAREGTHHYIVQVRADDGSEWLMACDGERGKVIQAVDLRDY
jgi:hypothetical protein